MYKDCQHEEFVTTFWMFGKNAGNFQYSVRVNVGVTENAGMENPKPTCINEFNVNKNISHVLPVPLSLKLSIRHFANNVVMLYSLK